MKKTLILSIMFLCMGILYSCSNGTEEDIHELNALTKPIIVVGVLKPSSWSSGAITLRDSHNIYKTFRGEYYLGATLIASYKPGDTLK